MAIQLAVLTILCAGCFNGPQETAAKGKPKGVGTLGPVRGCIYLMFPFIVDTSFFRMFHVTFFIASPVALGLNFSSVLSLL